MFQTEPILWLQAAGSPVSTWLLSVVSLLGLSPVYIVLLLALGFGVRLRSSLATIVALLLAGLLAASLKAELALPRPDEVDARIRRGALSAPVALVERGGATGFWSLPRPEAIAVARSRVTHSFGFPSGHVAGATAFLLGTAVFFRSRMPLALAAFWVPAMALSRMYLGRHFLADVLGGLVVGIVAVGLAVPLVRLLERTAFSQGGRRGGAVLCLLAATPPALAPWASRTPSLLLGSLAGVVLAYALLSLTGPPAEAGSDRQRITRVILALGLSLLIAALFSGWLDDSPGWHPGPLVAGLVVSAAPLVGTIAIARRFRLYG